MRWLSIMCTVKDKLPFETRDSRVCCFLFALFLLLFFLSSEPQAGLSLSFSRSLLPRFPSPWLFSPTLLLWGLNLSQGWMTSIAVKIHVFSCKELMAGCLLKCGFRCHRETGILVVPSQLLPLHLVGTRLLAPGASRAASL